MKQARTCTVKQPMRPHFIREWMEATGYRQADIAKGTGANKTNVSNWVKGQSPGAEWQKPLADFFETTPAGLFRHPNEDRVASFFASLSGPETERAINVLKASFPEKERLLNQKLTRVRMTRSPQGIKTPASTTVPEILPPGEPDTGRRYIQVVEDSSGSTDGRADIPAVTPKAPKGRKHAK